MQTIHQYPGNESFVQHGREECACKPTKQVRGARQSTGRNGRSQGYKQTVTVYVHNPITEAANV